ncbi:MAG TPA: hypothetical protein VH723_07250 [Candidatus Limnocylindrales bacterium]|jgi:hypothetical protein
MNAQPSADGDLPALYRSILDGIADLERQGQHRAAGRLRAEATAAYSASWDERAARRLHSVHRRIGRLASGEERARAQAGGWLQLGRSLFVR